MNDYLSPFLVSLNWQIEDIGLVDVARASNLVGGNTGNLAFSYAIARHLELTHQIPVSWGGLTSELRNQERSCAVFAMANVLGPHVNLGSLAKEYHAFKGKIVVIGMGAQASIGQDKLSIPEGTLDFIKTVADHAPSQHPNMVVRGDFTLKVLEDHGFSGRCLALGCPSLFINPSPDLGAIIQINKTKSPSTLTVCAGHYQWTHLQRFEKKLVDLVDVHQGRYIVQSPCEMLRLASGEIDNISPKIMDQCRSFIRNDLDAEQFQHWCRSRVDAYYSAPEWMNAIRQSQFVIGFRIHGVMLALQAGIPGLCLVHDSRTLELCEKMMIPHLRIEDLHNEITLGCLWNQFWDVFNPAEFDANRRELACKYGDFLANNHLPSSPRLRSIYGA